MPRTKPIGWPKLMREKLLRSGAVGFFWTIPTWAKKAGCPLCAEALGTDYGAAKRRCDEVLNPQFRDWHHKGETVENGPREGSFDWAVSVYKTCPRFLKLSGKSRDDYDDALAIISNHKLTDGRKFGTVSLKSITPGAADRLFAAIGAGSGGRRRDRTAVMCMAVAKTMWNTVHRDRPDIVPGLNPFAKIDMSSYQPRPTRAVTPEELTRFVAAADAAGEPSIGTALMVAFFWNQRQVDILGRLHWGAYRPKDDPGIARIFHHKTGAIVPLPLYDEDGTALWPELMERLDVAPRRSTLIVTRDKPDRRTRLFLPWSEHYFRHRVADIREAAGIDAEVKFMGLRHGGNTAAADADLTDAQIRALSGHRTAAMTRLYAKQTVKQRRDGARKLLAARTKKGDLSE